MNIIFCFCLKAKDFQQMADSTDEFTMIDRFKQFLQKGVDIDGYDIAKRDIDKEIKRTPLSRLCIGLAKGQTNSRQMIKLLLKEYREKRKSPKNDS